MARYRLHHDEPVDVAVRRIAADQVDRALAAFGDDDRGVHDVIHRVRTRCKKVRALLRLVREVAPDLYATENAAFRDTARRLSDLRDASAVYEVCDALLDTFPAGADHLSPVRDILSARRDELVADADAEATLVAVAGDLRAVRERIDGWTVDADGFDALAGGLAKTYRRAVDRLADVVEDPTTEALHEWRKRIKYHRLHVRLLQDAWPAALRTRRSLLHDQTDDLGDDHDLAILRNLLHRDPDRFGGTATVATVTALIDRKRAALQQRGLARGRRLFAEQPDEFVDRLGAYWDIWRREPSEPPLLAEATVMPGD